MPSLPDWEQRFRNGESLVPPVTVNEELADRAEALFRSFIVSDLSSLTTPTVRMGDITYDMWIKVVRALFGSYDPATGVRGINDIFICIPKKNSKTTAAALIMLTALFMSDRMDNRLVLVAPTIGIADEAFGIGANALRDDPDRFGPHVVEIQDYIRTITRLRTRSKLLVKAASLKAVTGGRQSGTLIDETHVFQTIPHSEDMFVELRGARTTKPDAFTIQITTMAKQEHTGVMLEELNTARAVRDGRADPDVIASSLPVIYEWPEDMLVSEAWRDSENWWMANPGYGHSVQPLYLKQEYQKAVESGKPDKMALFASQHLNVPITGNLSEGRWTAADLWDDAVAEFDITLDELIERSNLLAVGIDAGGLDDLLALAVIGREKDTRRWLHWQRSWVDTAVFDRRPMLKERFDRYEAEGSLVYMDEAEPDKGRRELSELVRSLQDTGKLPPKQTIGMDRIGDKLLPDTMVDNGITTKRMCAVKQMGYQHGIIRTIEHKLRDGSLVHGGHELMHWCVNNVFLIWRGSSIAITKEHAVDKIDPISAMLNAADRMAALADTTSRSHTVLEVDFQV